MNSDGRYEPVSKPEEVKEEIQENTELEDLEWLARFIEEQVSLAKSIGRKEAELRGESNMKQIYMLSGAAAVFSFAASAVTVLNAYGMLQ